MIAEGQIVLFRFPQTNLTVGKLRPALILRPCRGSYNDWLVCMISTQLHQQIPSMDECLTPSDDDFEMTGLKSASIVRTTRLAVVEGSIFKGMIGGLEQKRLNAIYDKIASWIA